MNRISFPALLLAAIALVLAPDAGAQSLWMPRDHPRAMRFELAKPMIDGVDEEVLTFVGFAGLRSHIRSGFSIVGEAGIARFADGGGSSFTLGDVYLGGEQTLGSRWWMELGVRVPTTSDHEVDAQVIGIVSDVARWEVWFPDALSATGGVNFRTVSPSGIALRARLCPSVLIPTEGVGQHPEWFAIYSGQFGYEDSSIRAGFGLVGRVHFSDPSTFSDRNTMQADFHLDFGSGSARPGVDVRIPLDSDLREVVPVIIGVSLNISH